MNADQKQRARTVRQKWVDYEWSGPDGGPAEFEVVEIANAMAALLQELIDSPEAEPFGYFKAEPLGWTDCAETDDGAIALYELPPAHSVPDMPLSMEQFGGLVGLARDDASEKYIVYKATNIYGETCYFGVKSTAQAWAKNGSVDEVRLRDLRLVATQTPPEPPADLVRDAKPDIWRVMCGDWRDKTVAIHNSAGYITCGLDPAKSAALVRAHNGEMSDGAAAIERDKLKGGEA